MSTQTGPSAPNEGLFVQAAKYLTRAKKVKVEGSVYCLTHTTIHDDTLDPYDEGRPTCFDDLEYERTKETVHRALYAGLVKGDIDEEEL